MSAQTLGLIGILVSLGLLIFLALRGFTLLLAAPGAAIGIDEGQRHAAEGRAEADGFSVARVTTELTGNSLLRKTAATDGRGRHGSLRARTRGPPQQETTA